MSIGVERALKNLYEQVFLPEMTKWVAELDDYFRKNKTILAQAFVESFRQLCVQAAVAQGGNGKAPIAFIHYSLLRTSLLDGTYTYAVEAYSDKWYGDSNACMVSYDVGWAFSGLTKLFQQLEQHRKAYIDLLHPGDMEVLSLKCCAFITPFVVSLGRYAVVDAMRLPEFQQVVISDKLRVRIGEYKDFSEDIYVKQASDQEPDAIRRLLTTGSSQQCMYACFDELFLPKGQCFRSDFRYSDFRGSDLSGWSFQACMLVGTRWNDATLVLCDFSDSLLCDADFRGADLRSAVFCGSSGSGLDDVLYRVPGLLGVQFSGANLSGADFTDAMLYDADFEDAIMQDAIFLERDKGRYRLTEQQEQAIRWI